MGVARPTGQYAEEMLSNGAWPEVDEDTLSDRAQTLAEKLRQVTLVLESWAHEQAELFTSETWSGSAAEAAAVKVTEVIASLRDQQHDLAKAILWYRATTAAVVTTKGTVVANVETAQADISAILATQAFNPDWESQLESTVATAQSANHAVVANAAALVAPVDFRPPRFEMNKLIKISGNRKTLPAEQLAAPQRGPCRVSERRLARGS